MAILDILREKKDAYVRERDEALKLNIEAEIKPQVDEFAKKLRAELLAKQQDDLHRLDTHISIIEEMIEEEKEREIEAREDEEAVALEEKEQDTNIYVYANASTDGVSDVVVDTQPKATEATTDAKEEKQEEQVQAINPFTGLPV